MLTQRPGLLGQGPKLFRLFSRRFRLGAVALGAVALLIRFLPEILSRFALLLGRDTDTTQSRSVVRHIGLFAVVGPSVGGNELPFDIWAGAQQRDSASAGVLRYAGNACGRR